MSIKNSLCIALSASTALALTACADAFAPSDQPANPTTVTVAESASATQPTQQDQSQAQEAPISTEDPVFAAFDAVLAQYPGAVIVEVDREDNSLRYDIDVVVDGQLIEIDVDSGTGNIVEEDRDDDDDEEDIYAAQNATVTAEQAARQALETHPDGVIDEMELEEEDGALRWEIEIDDQNRNDLAELIIPAV